MFSQLQNRNILSCPNWNNPLNGMIYMLLTLIIYIEVKDSLVPGSHTSKGPEYDVLDIINFHIISRHIFQ